jgi:predicted nucleotidyltransferase
MRSVFTTLVSSRFVDREAVVEALRRLAQRLLAQHDAIAAIHLFGSFATGTATPRSDADILVELASDDPVLREHLMEAAQSVFLEAPVPVEVFALASMRLKEARGVAGAVAREGVRLA